MADTLHAPSSSCEPLTRVIFERTEGNPFFFTQFLDALHKEGCCGNDPKKRMPGGGTWTSIKSRDFADNVADLMAGKLRRLPRRSAGNAATGRVPGQQVRPASSRAGGRSLPKTRPGSACRRRFAKSLILRADGIGKFLHDRIQQAAYALITRSAPCRGPPAHRPHARARA